MMSKACSHVPQLLFALFGLCSLGCGGDTADNNSNSSHEEITSFLEENPEFVDPGPQSETDALGLER
jgi:hypothetical protein